MKHTYTKKLKDVTPAEYSKWFREYHAEKSIFVCESCPLHNTQCDYQYKSCWVRHKELYSSAFLNQEIEIPKNKVELGKDETIILDSLNKKFKYIFRDENGGLHISKTKPIKNIGINAWGSLDSERLIFDHLFDFIEWEDEEPYSIEKLLEIEDED